MGSDHSASANAGSGDPLTPTERAVYGATSVVEVRRLLDGWTTKRPGSAIREVRFRAGRIDAVWGVDLTDGCAVVLKAHRPPTDLESAAIAVDAQRFLVSSGFPCATPLAGPERVEGRTLTAESLIEGTRPDGRDPGMRRVLAEGLAVHIDLLRARPDLVSRVGPGPSWCRYQAGPWPEPHDSAVDLASTPAGFEWLDSLGRRASEQILTNRDADSVVVGHADWYAGNTVVAAGALAGTFNWELVADSEAVIAGFAAACYAASSTSGGGLSTPPETAAFLREYEEAAQRSFSERERHAATGAAAWIIAFNARWHVGLLDTDHFDPETLSMAREDGEEYLEASW